MSLIDGNFSDLKSTADVFPVKVPCEKSLCADAFSASVKLTKSPDKHTNKQTNLPKRSGPEVISAARKNHRCQSIIVIIFACGAVLCPRTDVDYYMKNSVCSSP